LDDDPVLARVTMALSSSGGDISQIVTSGAYSNSTGAQMMNWLASLMAQRKEHGGDASPAPARPEGFNPAALVPMGQALGDAAGAFGTKGGDDKKETAPAKEPAKAPEPAGAPDPEPEPQPADEPQEAASPKKDATPQPAADKKPETPPKPDQPEPTGAKPQTPTDAKPADAGAGGKPAQGKPEGNGKPDGNVKPEGGAKPEGGGDTAVAAAGWVGQIVEMVASFF
jgi:outer membrane biosynthesis protein TonB